VDAARALGPAEVVSTLTAITQPGRAASAPGN